MSRLMSHARPLSLILAVALSLSGLVAWSGAASLQSNEQVVVAGQAMTPASCVQQLQLTRQHAYPDQYRLPQELSLISWNIYKAQRDNLQSDLQHLNAEADILLLQEALLDKNLLKLKPYWRFAPGYKEGDQQTGVLTLSRWPAVLHCHFEHTEPWLRTPKATNIVQYLLHDGRQLLAINLHAINFSLGLEDYRQQLDDALAVVNEHQGPVIFAGDLNSWSLRRGKLLDQRLQALGLQPATFADDNRTRFRGQPLDHVWLRGIAIQHTAVPVVSSSDHNPLLVSFNLRTPEASAPAESLAVVGPTLPRDAQPLQVQ